MTSTVQHNLRKRLCPVGETASGLSTRTRAILEKLEAVATPAKIARKMPVMNKLAQNMAYIPAKPKPTRLEMIIRGGYKKPKRPYWTDFAKEKAADISKNVSKEGRNVFNTSELENDPEPIKACALFEPTSSFHFDPPKIPSVFNFAKASEKIFLFGKDNNTSSTIIDDESKDDISSDEVEETSALGEAIPVKTSTLTSQPETVKSMEIPLATTVDVSPPTVPREECNPSLEEKAQTWNCTSCFVQNTGIQCVCCNTPKDGAPAAKLASASFLPQTTSIFPNEGPKKYIFGFDTKANESSDAKAYAFSSNNIDKFCGNPSSESPVTSIPSIAPVTPVELPFTSSTAVITSFGIPVVNEEQRPPFTTTAGFNFAAPAQSLNGGAMQPTTENRQPFKSSSALSFLFQESGTENLKQKNQILVEKLEIPLATTVDALPPAIPREECNPSLEEKAQTWNCTSCFVQNTGIQCVCCNTPKDGAPAAKLASASFLPQTTSIFSNEGSKNYAFGFNAKPSDSADSKASFNFELPVTSIPSIAPVAPVAPVVPVAPVELPFTSSTAVITNFGNIPVANEEQRPSFTTTAGFNFAAPAQSLGFNFGAMQPTNENQQPFMFSSDSSFQAQEGGIRKDRKIALARRKIPVKTRNK